MKDYWKFFIAQEDLIKKYKIKKRRLKKLKGKQKKFYITKKKTKKESNEIKMYTIKIEINRTKMFIKLQKRDEGEQRLERIKLIIEKILKEVLKKQKKGRKEEKAHILKKKQYKLYHRMIKKKEKRKQKEIHEEVEERPHPVNVYKRKTDKEKKLKKLIETYIDIEEQLEYFSNTRIKKKTEIRGNGVLWELAYERVRAKYKRLIKKNGLFFKQAVIQKEKIEEKLIKIIQGKERKPRKEINNEEVIEKFLKKKRKARKKKEKEYNYNSVENILSAIRVIAMINNKEKKAKNKNKKK